ncbi:hypothetical protein P152DRAFT_390675 [Eremomyces bilateralis CBS 781.70]|uniref:BZIP domain-containing protein n=1 Tax=Eremomyces bilateralis CBS 781.70 TaxID=1392243 RepID=A0A6G1GBJ0_9PEZI|nr:uncharacterized protein P152DRAFT_390675 [Eremomyces bilateralis CBS 781.70]KAF1815306.1 hypothetical protein P152DRAFT_390675 [Eremomyces bilateralis CBS 781.70]
MPKKRSRSPPDDFCIDKRRRNNLAAAKYRQKKVDRISELESVVADVTRERDDLKLQLAMSNREIELLRNLLSKKE